MTLFDIIFFDLDGPILEGKYKHYMCYRDILTERGANPLTIEKYWDMKRHKIKRDIVLKKSQWPGTYNEFLEEWLKYIENLNYLQLDILKPQADATLRNLKTYTNKIILVTLRAKRQNLLKQLKHLGIEDVFDEIINCDFHLENSKYEAIKHFSFKQALFIGDTEEDQKTASLLNIPFIAVTNGLRHKDFLEADLFINDINKLNFANLTSLSKKSKINIDLHKERLLKVL